jgi:DNA invertase Pin-like site-specific DNA recombinase
MIPNSGDNHMEHGKAVRAGIYTRVSTDKQTVENQIAELRAVATQRGWTIAEVYKDEGISGAKGRDQRPVFDKMLKDAASGKLDVVMGWAIDRFGRSLLDLLQTLQTLDACKVDVLILRQNLDTTLPMGRLMFQIVGAFAEFEREMLRSRINAGLARARAKGKRLGRKPITAGKAQAIKDALSAPERPGFHKIAKAHGVGSSVVQRIAKEMAAT